MDQAKALLAQAENATHLQDWQLGLVALGIVILLGIIIAAIRGKIRRARERREDEDAAAYYAAQERADQERAERERAAAEAAAATQAAAAEAAAASAAAAAAAAAVPQAAPPAAPVVAEPVTPTPPPAPAAAPERRDDLTIMKGVGPRLEEKLNSLGINSFAQIAALTPAEAADLDSKLGDFKGRLERDHWIEQAQLLAAADHAAYEAKFGKL